MVNPTHYWLVEYGVSSKDDPSSWEILEQVVCESQAAAVYWIANQNEMTFEEMAQAIGGDSECLKFDNNDNQYTARPIRFFTLELLKYEPD